MIPQSFFDSLTKMLSNQIFLDLLAFVFLLLAIFTLTRIIYRVFIMPSHKNESEIANEDLSTTYQFYGEDIDI